MYAHLKNLPAGKYRVRVKADTDCLMDEIDIRPAMDVGVSIIEKTNPFAHYDHIFKDARPPVMPAFYDYTANTKTGEPFAGLPRIKGKGTITIKNGIIESETDGILSWGILSTAKDVKVTLENLLVKNSGISSGGAHMPWGDIISSSFEMDIPFLIQRHSNLCAATLTATKPSEIKYTLFNGGQGNLSVAGKNSLVHDNVFINHQTVTNHYSIMGTGDSSKIYSNYFVPKQGSGIYVTKYTEVFNNYFRIETSPPTCEYGREEYSTAAIRLGDYGAAPGSPGASVGNRIYHNKIDIIAKTYPAPKEYLPMAWGIFYSASGGENYVYDNEFTVDKQDTSSCLKTAALYICGGPKYFGGSFHNNKIVTNVPAAWIATMYGGASNSDLCDNIIIPLKGAKFKTFTVGYAGREDCVAKNVKFRSNIVLGNPFELDVTAQDHSYSVSWTVSIKVLNKRLEPLPDYNVVISDVNKKVVYTGKTDHSGIVNASLLEYKINGAQKSTASPYIIMAGKYKRLINIDSNKEVTCIINEG